MLTCCQRCCLYDTCELKWYRSERGDAQLCCEMCEWFDQCRVKEIEEEIRELPSAYGETMLILMVIDPLHLHACWEIASQTWEKIKSGLGEGFDNARKVLRVYDVSYINFDGTNANSYFDIYVGDANNWYINIWSPIKSLCAELGLIAADGEFHPLVRSNFVHTPQSGPSGNKELRNSSYS